MDGLDASLLKTELDAFKAASISCQEPPVALIGTQAPSITSRDYEPALTRLDYIYNIAVFIQHVLVYILPRVIPFVVAEKTILNTIYTVLIQRIANLLCYCTKVPAGAILAFLSDG